MRKLFGHKPKGKPALARDSEEIPRPSPPGPVTTPLYHKLATYGTDVHTIPTTEEESQSPQGPLPAINAPSHTPSFNSIPAGTSPIASADPPQPPRSGSPASLAHTLTTLPPTVTNVSTTKLSKDRDGRRKNPNQSTAPVALSILRALEPPRPESKTTSNRSQSEERYTVSESGHSYRDRDRDSGDKKEKRSFWGVRDKEREKEKEREREVMLQREKDRGAERTGERERDRGREIWREDDGAAKLTHMIGYLTATAAEDWALLMDVCDRASASEANAKAAVRALRYEFKYGAPQAQLSAARLWAIMLRNSSEIFISQSTSRKFLDALEELLSSPKTSPVVRERVLEVVAAAAYASGNKKDGRHEKDGFRGLWKRVRPLDKPEEGIPFDTDDAMFQPPNAAQGPGYEVPFYQEPTSFPVDSAPITPVLRANKRKSPVRHRIITLDEDIRRLFQECAIGRGNAGLLSEALAHSKPEDLKKKDVIKEFYDKCRLSQELICAQIPWASAGAEHSRAMKDKTDIARNRTDSNDMNHAVEDGRVSVEQTVEEALLAALLMANADLMEALKQYDDLERVAIERQTEERSRKEVRMERKHRDIENFTELSVSSRPSTPQSRPHTPQHLNLAQPHPQHPPLSVVDNDPVFQSQNLAPPPAAPHGPRPPAPISLHTRTPSPGPQGLDFYTNGHDVYEDTQPPSLNGIGHDNPSAQPSAKALGKRKLVEPDSLSDPPDDVDATYFDKEHAFSPADGADPEFEDENDRWNHPTVHFVYDAVAERTRQRLEGREELVDNRVH